MCLSRWWLLYLSVSPPPRSIYFDVHLFLSVCLHLHICAPLHQSYPLFCVAPHLPSLPLHALKSSVLDVVGRRYGSISPSFSPSSPPLLFLLHHHLPHTNTHTHTSPLTPFIWGHVAWVTTNPVSTTLPEVLPNPRLGRKKHLCSSLILG